MTRLAHIPALLVALFIAGVALFAPAPAAAQATSADVRVILASNDGSVDPALASLAPRLTRQFSQFTAFRQFSQRSIPLAVGAPQRVTLPGDQVATIELRSAQNGELEIRVSIPGGGTTVRTRGGMFFVGGAPAPGGTVILAIQT